MRACYHLDRLGSLVRRRASRALYAEYNLRVPDPPGGYLFEAALGILWPFLALVTVPIMLALAHYHRVWLDLSATRLRAARCWTISAVDNIRDGTAIASCCCAGSRRR